MPLVYRLESKTGDIITGNNGAYRGGYLEEQDTYIANILFRKGEYLADKHPLPHYDPVLRPYCVGSVIKKYRFCFSSLDQLIDWFYIDEDAIRYVRELDVAKISVYKVPQEFLIESDVQSMALVDKMVLVDALEI
ncbi:hypothetical protein HWD03_gp076 [Alteromonas phage vB_AmeM_PT11-V22]|uniref:Uncharacterized protein n=1 Tax=Alteromonas phage vB_AmeM_PT11-V22 TaxID=2704031 RepID=A0A6C0R1Q8_9CAUD|nr:hypothetical protein HWD03_gp076 [Alteromonas phage vB_AmeM_PT11-V22]QHZ59836.1 hypothetical protein [Alteromonas phage vB_AmeM_PT11-V22]